MGVEMNSNNIERLILGRAGRLKSNELELVCLDFDGQPVPVTEILGVAELLEKLIFRVGEYRLGLDYRRRGRAKLSVRNRLGLVVEVPSNKRAFWLRLKIGDFVNIPFSENESFLFHVFDGLVSAINADPKFKEIHPEHFAGIRKAVENLRYGTRKFGKMFIVGLDGGKGHRLLEMVA